MKRTIAFLIACMAFPPCVPIAAEEGPEIPEVHPAEWFNTPVWDGGLSFTEDGLACYFHSDRDSKYGTEDIFVSRRAGPDAPWGKPEKLGAPINTFGEDFSAYILNGERTLYYASNRIGGMGNYDLYISERASPAVPWGTPVNLGPAINSRYTESSPSLTPDGLELYFADYRDTVPRPGGMGRADIWVARRASVDAPWEPAVSVGPPIDSRWDETGPRLSPDGLILFFAVDRDFEWQYDIWYSTRESLGSPWREPKRLRAPINLPDSDDTGGVISPDGTFLYFASSRLNRKSKDIWYAPIPGPEIFR